MTDKTDQQVYRIWVDWGRRIISFHEAEGFQQLTYPTYEEMLSFAVARGYAGFGIQ